MVKNTTFSTKSDVKNENSPSTSRDEGESGRLVRFEDEKKISFSLADLEFTVEKVVNFIPLNTIFFD